jgi:hypothetical protein
MSNYKCLKCAKTFTNLTAVCEQPGCGQELCPGNYVQVFTAKKPRKTVTARPKASLGLSMAQVWAESSVSEYSHG